MVHWTRTNKRTPNDLEELEVVISESHDTIKRFGTITVDSPKNPTTPIVNAINHSDTLATFKSNNQLFSSVQNNSNSNVSNDNNNSSNFNQNKSSFSSINNRGRGRNNRGRGNNNYRGTSRGNYRGGRGRCRGTYNGFNVSGQRYYNNGIPRFLPDYCGTCFKFGHYKRDCKYLHNSMPELMRIYQNKAGNRPKIKSESQVNVTTQDTTKSKNSNENDFTELLN